MAPSVAREPPNPTTTDEFILYGSLFRSRWVVGWRTNPELDRSDYWIQALQMFYAIRVSAYFRPLNDRDDLDEVRRWIYEGFDWTLRQRFTRWTICSMQIEANGDVGGPHGQSWGTVSYIFFFKELWKFLDLINGQSVSVEDKLKCFFSYHMECQMMFCKCEKCCNLYDRWQNIDKKSWLQIYTLDLVSVTMSFMEMSSWQTEETEDRLGREIDILYTYGSMTRSTFKMTRAALGTTERSVPTRDNLDFVVSRQDLGSNDFCPICMEQYNISPDENNVQDQHHPIRPRCGHVICVDCFDTWIATLDASNAFACPSCRQTFLAPPRHVENWATLKEHLNDVSVRPEVSAANVLQALKVYLSNLPSDQQTDVEFQPDLAHNHFGDLLQCLATFPSRAIRWAYEESDSASPQHYRETGQLAIEFLRLSGERLQSALNGDAGQYRVVLQRIWPIFVCYLNRMFMTEIFEWEDQILEQLG